MKEMISVCHPDENRDPGFLKYGRDPGSRIAGEDALVRDDK
jgi:hypothetical protein